VIAVKVSTTASRRKQSHTQREREREREKERERARDGVATLLTWHKVCEQSLHLGAPRHERCPWDRHHHNGIGLCRGDGLDQRVLVLDRANRRRSPIQRQICAIGPTRVRCVSIFLDKNRRDIGKSQSKRPPKRTQRTPHPSCDRHPTNTTAISAAFAAAAALVLSLPSS
jgi:hypothetical protein